MGMHLGVTDVSDGPTLTPQQPFTLHASCALLQDVFSADKLALKWDSPSPVALFANPFASGQTEALVVALTCDLQHLKRSPAGWVTEPVGAVAAKAKEVLAVVAPDGVVWSFLVGLDDLVVTSRLTAEGWVVVPNEFKGTWKNLKVVYTAPLPMRVPIVYGTHPRNAQVLKFAWWNAPGKWTQRYADMPSDASLADAKIWLYPGADDRGGSGQ
jgi:hypothetical protein